MPPSKKRLYVVGQHGEPMKPGNPEMPKSLRVAFENREEAEEAVSYESEMGTDGLEVLVYVKEN